MSGGRPTLRARHLVFHDASGRIVHVHTVLTTQRELPGDDNQLAADARTLVGQHASSLERFVAVDEIDELNLDSWRVDVASGRLVPAKSQKQTPAQAAKSTKQRKPSVRAAKSVDSQARKKAGAKK